MAQFDKKAPIWQDAVLKDNCLRSKYFFEHKNEKYCLYLLWRITDPYTANLLRLGDTILGVDSVVEWITLDIPFLQKDQLDEVKQSAITATKEKLNIKKYETATRI